MIIPNIIFNAWLQNGNHVKIMVYKSLTRVDVDLLDAHDFDEDVDLTKEGSLIKLKEILKKATLNDDEINEMIEILKGMVCSKVLPNLQEK